VTIEANNLVSLASAKELYLASMESVCGGDKPYINDQVLDIEHTSIVDKALAEFDSRKKLGGEEFSLKYRDQLLTEIEESYQHYKAHNDSKNIFKAANTPITLFVMWTVLYIFSQVSSLLMLYPLANLANLLMWGLILLGATWAYAKYSGEFSGVGVQIEELTGRFWDSVFQPLLNKIYPGSRLAVKMSYKRTQCAEFLKDPSSAQTAKAMEQGTEMAAKQAVKRLNSVSAKSSPFPEAKKTR